MARQRRQASPTGVYHWINRGINKRNLFHNNKDYSFFKSILVECKELFEIRIFHYCFMANHIHMLLHSDSLENLSKSSQRLQRRYTYFYCKTYQWTGAPFQGRYKSLVVDKDEYLLECGRYIERNPLKAGIVQDLSQYPYTSFNFYSKGHPDPLLTPSPGYLALSDDDAARKVQYTSYVSETRIQEEMQERIKIPF